MSQALALHNATQLTPLTGSLDAYIHSVNSIPVLESEDEQNLARELREQGDLTAAQTLVMSNLRFVVHIARGYMGYGLPMADLIQEGNIGLMKAVKRFDPDVGVRLISFAVHWIKAEIHEFVLKNWRIVKVATTKAQRKLFFNLRSSKNRLGWMNQDEVNAIAKDLNVKPETVLQMERRLSGQDISFAMGNDDDEDATYAPEQYLSDSIDPADVVETDDWEARQRAQLATALDALDDRSRDILNQRWLAEEGQKTGLKELAEVYDISAERVRQIEVAAIKKLRKSMTAVEQAA